MPLAWTLLLSVSVLRLGPTDLFDVRHAITTTIFAAALWRPYSLVRRIIRSLRRTDADLVAAVGYVLDLAAFGLLWWQVWTWPSELTSNDAGRTETLLGLGAAGAVALGLSGVIWVLLLREVDRATGHRAIACERGVNAACSGCRGSIRWVLWCERRCTSPSGGVGRQGCRTRT